MGKLRFIVVMVAVSEHTPDAGEATATAIIAAVSNFFGGDFLAPMVRPTTEWPPRPARAVTR